jgi:chemotaxis protein methyltransferase CheR
MVNAERVHGVIKVDPVERHLFLEGVFLRYGYDFRQYAEASLDRRLSNLLGQYNLDSLIDLLKRVLASADAFREILPQLTINTTEFFRDPIFFRTLRETVFPVLKTYPRIVVWVAGCSTGEEVISLAIALQEENLLNRTLIHATDINPNVLKKAKEAIYDSSLISSFNKNYVAAGGTKSPSEYYFSEHNLVTDAPFIEANLILCRNVLIYFNRELQERAFNLFARSLTFKGYLGIGSKETIRFSPSASYFETVNQEQNIYSLKAQPVRRL